MEERTDSEDSTGDSANEMNSDINSEKEHAGEIYVFIILLLRDISKVWR